MAIKALPVNFCYFIAFTYNLPKILDKASTKTTNKKNCHTHIYKYTYIFTFISTTHPPQYK